MNLARALELPLLARLQYFSFYLSRLIFSLDLSPQSKEGEKFRTSQRHPQLFELLLGQCLKLAPEAGQIQSGCERLLRDA